uniref:Uncharacterized protein n=1 Tax=Rhizophora mucronata TaxID=61149 RepID=A0A2P2Q062_RHIMU
MVTKITINPTPNCQPASVSLPLPLLLPLVSYMNHLPVFKR